jgi:AraC family transcriptional regulator
MLQFFHDKWSENHGRSNDDVRCVSTKIRERAKLILEDDDLESTPVMQEDASFLKTIIGTMNPTQDAARKGGLAGWQIKRVKDFIENELDRSISVHALSCITSLSPSHFAHAFRTSFGIAPHRYIVFCRLRRATNLIMNGDLSLCEIALTCGFADQPHLCRIFKRHFAQAPVAWRRQKRAEYRSIVSTVREYV